MYSGFKLYPPSKIFTSERRAYSILFSIIYYMHLPLYYNFISAILKNYPYIIYLFRNNYRICKKYHKYIAFFSQR